MIAVKAMDVRNNFKAVCNRVFDGETLIISRPKNQNIVMISEKEYDELDKIRRNKEYLSKLDRSFEQAEHGEFIVKTMDELRTME